MTTHLAIEVHDRDPTQWSEIWDKALPTLALLGPASWFAAALVRALGIGTLAGDLSWISRPEGFIMVLGAPFFAATFIYLGRTVGRRSARAGVLVTALGMMGLAPLAAIAGLRLFMGQFTDAGLSPDVLQRAFDTFSVWYLGFFVMNGGQFLAWIIAGAVILRTRTAPWWVAACLILGVLSVITGQGLYFALELFWPLGTGLWTAGILGLITTRHPS